MDSQFEKFWNIMQKGGNWRNKYLAKKFWVYAVKWSLLNVYSESKLRDEIRNCNIDESKKSKEFGLKFLNEARR